MIAWSLVVGLGLGAGLWVLASLLPRMSGPRLARRVAPYVADVSAGARASLAPPSPGPLPVVGLLLAPLTERGVRALTGLLGGSQATTARLRQAGSPLTLPAFRARQLLWAVGGSLVGVAAAVALARSTAVPLIAQLAIIPLAAAGGVVLRDTLLQRAAKARVARLEAELPVILEFLTLSLSAGEGILDSLRRVTRVSRGELAVELGGVVSAVGTGLPLAETLQALARDLGLPPFTRCVDQLVGALERGTPLAEVLRAQAQDSRDESKRRLIELAGKKEIGMLVPLVFLILPVTILFAVFPGVFVLQVGI